MIHRPTAFLLHLSHGRGRNRPSRFRVRARRTLQLTAPNYRAALFGLSQGRGFSLVELSIVLVILGLLVGGILAGQSLIRASELRAVGTEHERWMTAVNSFKDKYFATPGKMLTATSIWGKDATTCNSAVGTAGTPGTCNGSGDGLIYEFDREQFLFWQHLVLAGLIEGTYTGKPITGGTGTAYDIEIGTNVPRSKLANAGWAAGGYWNTVGDAGLYVFSGAIISSDSRMAGNFFSYGADDNANPQLRTGILLPQEAWNIDSKLDDGVPNSGKIFARRNGNLCANLSGASPPQNFASGVTYSLSNTAANCSLYFVRQF